MEDERIKSIVRSLFDDFKKEKGSEPTLKDIVQECIYLKGITTADYLFESLALGWKLNEYPTTDIKALNREMFPFDRNYWYEQLEEYVDAENKADLDAHYNQSKHKHE